MLLISLFIVNSRNFLSFLLVYFYHSSVPSKVPDIYQKSGILDPITSSQLQIKLRYKSKGLWILVLGSFTTSIWGQWQRCSETRITTTYESYLYFSSLVSLPPFKWHANISIKETDRNVVLWQSSDIPVDLNVNTVNRVQCIKIRSFCSVGYETTMVPLGF